MRTYPLQEIKDSKITLTLYFTAHKENTSASNACIHSQESKIYESINAMIRFWRLLKIIRNQKKPWKLKIFLHFLKKLSNSNTLQHLLGEIFIRHNSKSKLYLITHNSSIKKRKVDWSLLSLLMINFWMKILTTWFQEILQRLMIR